VRVPLLDLRAQFAPIRDEVLTAIARVCDDQRFIMGPEVEGLESMMAPLTGSRHAIGVSSGTDALLVALMALGIGPGDEVITTTHTFTATAEVVRYLGADVVLVDIDPATLCIDVAAVEAAITPRTKAVIPVHYAGLAADMQSLLAVAKRHGLKVVEDAAHALPTTVGGQLVGTLDSDITVFSFYANKTITTGEGGMVVTRDPELAKRIKVMRLHGMSRDAFDRFTAKVPSWYYEIVAPGFKYNLTDIASALGIHQLKRWPACRWCCRRSRLRANSMRGTCTCCAWPTMPRSRATC
jgi:dTDP-4-amino-4,6-dideoxygalactose transaminase